VPGFTSPLTN